MMEPLEVFEVISPVPEEAAVYRDITADVMSDLRLASAIGRIHVAIYPVKALYIMTAILRDVEMPIRISDMATADTAYENEEDYVRITIEREKYMPELTRFLWDRYTPANVVQADRWTILIRADEPAKEAKALPDRIIANPAQNMHANMVEFSVRAVPEGFRVRYHTFEKNEFLFIASEDVIEPRWLELGQKLMADLRKAKASITENNSSDGMNRESKRAREDL
jgi:putative methanogenesis marker protein 17